MGAAVGIVVECQRRVVVGIYCIALGTLLCQVTGRARCVDTGIGFVHMLTAPRGALATYEGWAVREKLMKDRDLGNVPATAHIDGGEAGAVGKHMFHAYGLGGVPTAEGDGSEVGTAAEHFIHYSHVAGVPTGKVEGGEGGTVVECLFHVFEFASAPTAEPGDGCEASAIAEYAG